MADVIVQLPVEAGEEAQLFGSYLNRFMEARTADADRMARTSDAPYVMIRSDPAPDRELKVLTFQAREVAQAFSSGWAQARSSIKVRAS